MKQVGRELGVRYVLEGSVRKAGNRVRIAAQLIDALSGTHLWAGHSDGSLEDIFELQEGSVERCRRHRAGIAGRRGPRSVGLSTSDLTAYDLYLRAYAMVWASAGQTPEALRLMEQAIARDPRYGPALAGAALCCYRLVTDGRSEDPAADRLKGTDFARRALEVAGDDPGILTNTAVVLAAFGEDIGAMMALLDRALALNPNFAHGWFISGVVRTWAGQPDLGIEHAEASLRLSPRVRVKTALVNAACNRLGAGWGPTRVPW